MTSQYRIPAPLQNTIDNLSYIGNTEEGDKLFFKENIHISSTSWLARLRRYYQNECLETQKKIIKEIVESGLDSLKTYKDNVHYSRLLHQFNKAKNGLCNLKNTYLKQGYETTDLSTQIYIMENQIEGLPEKEKIDAGIIVVPDSYSPPPPLQKNTSNSGHNEEEEKTFIINSDISQLSPPVAGIKSIIPARSDAINIENNNNINMSDNLSNKMPVPDGVRTPYNSFITNQPRITKTVTN